MTDNSTPTTADLHAPLALAEFPDSGTRIQVYRTELAAVVRALLAEREKNALSDAKVRLVREALEHALYKEHDFDSDECAKCWQGKDVLADLRAALDREKGAKNV